ncbi:MAG: peptidase U32 family protein [Candidatus Pacearchaeota archaeon]|jgi:putative protease|nr:peptidase U32 family protein [Candidatus Pacearchaeota archaeon]|tara:strand:+ start:352 stop:1521 length:1170 start_codon:yes stop_codon:yes gene_type:complete
MKQKYELLAPAGNFPMLTTAIKAGANAIYFGLQEFSMRESARNFKINDLKNIKKICGKKVKMYLTMNTIIYDNEVEKVEKIIKEIKDKVDAIICWDLSIIQLCKKYKIPFHISTQASVSNTDTAKFYKKLGAKRIVLARELNLKQIRDISKIIDIECFIHGALCSSISGRCFTSQFLFNSSANRGKCLHPCRRSYIVKDNEGNELKVENNKIFSAKDLCTLPFIEKLKKAGITSFKIEGRNRDPRYVDIVVRTYRKAIDKKLSKKEIENSINELKKIYNKGFSSGFYLGVPTSDDIARIENSASIEKKHFVGKITHYYPKIKVATIKLVSNLKIGDEIIVIGKSTGLEKSFIKHIEINRKSVKIGKKGEEIGIKLPLVRKNDEVYIIKK